jgi:hypothetical protein
VLGLVAKRSGSVAWIVRSVRDSRYQQHPVETAVRAMALHRPITDLDLTAGSSSAHPQPPEPADEIDPASLALTTDRSAVTWKRLDGRELSAPLR